MKAKTVGIAAGAGFLGLSAVAASKGKSMHERCRETFTRMAGQVPSDEGKGDRCGPSSEESGAEKGCGPTACRK
jgi:hypothetical protein